MLLKVSDKVTFDSDSVDQFIQETSGKSKELDQYQKLVLAGINQVGVVKEPGEPMTTVSFPDGWDLPIPTKYLVKLPEV